MLSFQKSCPFLPLADIFPIYFFFLEQQPLSVNHSSQPSQMKPVCHEAGGIQMPIWIDLQPGPHPLSSNTSPTCPDATVQPCTQKKSLFLSLAEEYFIQLLQVMNARFDTLFCFSSSAFSHMLTHLDFLRVAQSCPSNQVHRSCGPAACPLVQNP